MTSLPCNRTNDALVGSTRIRIMPEMRIQNRNYSTYPTMPKPCSTIGSRLKHPRVTWLLKDLDMDLNTMEDLSEGFHMWSSNQLPLQMLTDTSHLQSFILWDNFSHGFLAVNWQHNNKTTTKTNSYATQVWNGQQFPQMGTEEHEAAMGPLQWQITQKTAKPSQRFRD